ncbi:MAG: hypothetical protein ABI158_11920 [Edaphobacter sp.]
MRRFLAISLLLLFGFPLVSPLFALSANSETSLPACCRRNGAHHCQMNIALARASTHQDAAFATPMKCPFYPGAATLVRHNDARLYTIATLLVEATHPSTVKAPTYATVQIALDTAWQKRGPPAVAS